MNEELQNQINELTARVTALEQEKAARERQQLSYPLDAETIEILGKNFMRITSTGTYYGGVGGNLFPFLEGTQDNLRFQVFPGFDRYVATASSDVITLLNPSPYNRYDNDQTVVFFTEDTVPAGLTAEGLVTYYVVSAAADGYSFKVSATQGGAAVNITSAGTGRQFIEKQ